jgi:DNA polymerase-1
MNYQNLPRKNELLKGIESKEGFTFFFFDYSQIELRIAAYYLKDQAWIDAFNNHEDIHTQTSEILFGRPHQTEDERTFSKNFNFGMSYGAGAPRITGMLQELLGGKREEHEHKAQEMLHKFHKKHPSIRNFQNIVKDRMMSDAERTDFFINRLRWKGAPPRKASYRGSIKNRFGRKYIIPANLQYKALEWIVSGDATGDFHTKKFTEISEFFEERKLNGGPAALKHDEIVCEIEDVPYQETIVQEIKLIMEDDPVITKLLPLKVDVEYGKNWLEKKEWLPTILFIMLRKCMKDRT